jgi:hypothetical protein
MTAPVHTRALLAPARHTLALAAVFVAVTLLLPASGRALGGASTTAAGEATKHLLEERHRATGRKVRGLGGVGGIRVPLRSHRGAITNAPGGAISAPQGGAAAPLAASTTPSTTLSRSPALAGGLLSSANRSTAHAHGTSKHSSTLAIVVGVLGALLLLACGAWALARRRGVEPHWWLSLRHSVAEAGYRVSGTWAEFTDWARLGR